MILNLIGEKAVLQTRATPVVLNVVGSLEGRRKWLDGGGLQVENTPHNISVLTSIEGVEIVDLAAEASVSPMLEADKAFDPGREPYKPKTTPYAHQTEALEKMADKPFFGLFMEQGTGKTKALLDRAGELWCGGHLTGILIVSKKGVHRQWIESEAEAHLNVPWSGLHWPFKGLHDNMRPDPEELKLVAFNYDGIKTKKGFIAAEEFCQAHRGKLMIIADESQEMKNQRTARHKTMMQLRPYSEFRALATGTPIAKDLTDEWAQMKWLDDRIIGVKYITTFRAKYCIMGGFEGRDVVGHRNVEEFKEKTAPYTFRATKDELGIAPKQYNRWTYDLTAEQRRLIKELKDDLETTLTSGDKIEISDTTAIMNKVQQISSGFIIDGDEERHRLFEPLKNPRVKAALEWLGAGEGKAIIWARFREDMAILHEAMDAEGIEHVQYHGGVKDKDRAANVKSFLTEEGAQVFLANPQSAGTGLNLQGLCQRALYYTNSFNAIDRWQSEDRIHRIGTVGAVTYTDMIAKRSIDQYILNNLKRKKGLSDLVLDDAIKLIKELL